ncbi:MAG: ATPase [Proteobacteria bacterium]|nr:MAG: ATPase [Pseudomonadota bacterium]
MKSTASKYGRLLDSETKIGRVTHVTAAGVELELLDPAEVQNREVDITRGKYVLLARGATPILGQIIDLRPNDHAPAQGASKAERFGLIGSARLLVTFEMKEGRFLPGVLSPPQVGDGVHSVSSELVKMVAEGNAALGKEDKRSLTLSLSRLRDGTPLSFTPEMIFGRHFAIFGSSGGGKSWSLARLMEEVANCHSKVVLFDATGEFHLLSRGVRHIYMGDYPDANPTAGEVVLPFYHLSERDLFAIFKPSGSSQAPKLRAAIQSLKLAWRESALAPDGTIHKMHRNKKPIEDALRKHANSIEKPFAEFDISKLCRQIENECVTNQRSPQEPGIWGDINSIERSHCVALINRIEDILRSPSLAPIFAPENKRSLFSEISAFMKDPTLRVLRISLRYLSFAHHAREIVANAAGRFLLEAAREGYFRQRPLLVAVDEAHQFLNKALESENDVYPLDSFGLIAKEGRKYSLNICIATQRPRDIPEAVLSQVGTMLVHRLISEADQRVVESACSSLDRDSLTALPSLAPGEAFLVGVDFPIPLHVQMVQPESEPSSHGPDFQRYWGWSDTLRPVSDAEPEVPAVLSDEQKIN